MVDDAGREEDGSRFLELESVRHDERHSKRLRRRQPASFLDQSAVVVRADELDVVWKRAFGREPAQHVAGSAPHVDDSDRPCDAVLAKSREKRSEKLGNAQSVLELFGNALHLAVNANEPLVHCVRIEEPVSIRHRFDQAHRASVAA